MARNVRGFWREQKVLLLGLGILYAGMVPLALEVRSHPQGDVRLYYETSRAMFSGEWPYRDRTFEYPPFALLWYAPPALGGSLPSFQLFFALQILFLDLAVKAYLLAQGLRRCPGWGALVPLAAYSFGTAFLHPFYLQRMDLIPIALSMAAIVLFAGNRYFGSGAMLVLAAGTKLFPILFSPPLAVIAWRRGRLQRLLFGHTAVLAPLLVLGLFLPWWQFLAFHDARGLEVESLYASVLWILHFLIDLNIEWAVVNAWLEVTGPPAETLLPHAKGWMAGTVGFTILFASYCAWKSDITNDAAALSGLLLFALLPFVAFNIVLSPQYMIWLLVMASVALLSAAEGGGSRPALAPGSRGAALLFGSISIATALTPIWYPTPEFSTGLNLGQTVVVLGRNLVLIVVWLGLGWILWKKAGRISNAECEARKGDESGSMVQE